MPAFGDQLKPEEVSALVKYIRELSGMAGPSARSTAL
jgi:mono/diheme cytochrome c family protein